MGLIKIKPYGGLSPMRNQNAAGPGQLQAHCGDLLIHMNELWDLAGLSFVHPAQVSHLCVSAVGLAQRELHIPGEVSGCGRKCGCGVTAVRLHCGRHTANPGRVGGCRVVRWVAQDSGDCQRGRRVGVAYFGISGMWMCASETAAPAALGGVRAPSLFSIQYPVKQR